MVSYAGIAPSLKQRQFLAILTMGFSQMPLQFFYLKITLFVVVGPVISSGRFSLPPHIDIVGARASAVCVSSLLNVVRMDGMRRSSCMHECWNV